MQHILVTVGDSNGDMVQRVWQSVNATVVNRSEFLDGRVELRVLDHNPGFAGGCNMGLHAVHACGQPSSWGLIVNADIEFLPGSLEKLASTMHARVRNETFGVGFPHLAPHNTWSAFAITKRLIDRIGFFDENFYPMYHEDAEYSFRVYLSGLDAALFHDVQVLHADAPGHISKGGGRGLRIDFDLRGDPSWRGEPTSGTKLSAVSSLRSMPTNTSDPNGARTTKSASAGLI
jgi:hypothetical protein|mmetsp:Transcript_6781/g.15225  ORF Transcript_6781/g.15225 Transcript_6781/m.15225 type:complete len:232 (-) Transcript_6781:188-883(-)